MKVVNWCSEQAVVLYPWHGEQDNELTLKEGDTIALKRWISPEWLEGDLNGTIGMSLQLGRQLGVCESFRSREDLVQAFFQLFL